MPRIDELFLRDILKATGRIKRYTHDLQNAAELDQHEMTLDSILFNLMTIGEAVKNLPEEMKNRYPEVRWKAIARFRDRVTHHYFSLESEIIWEIATVHLPALEKAVAELLQNL